MANSKGKLIRFTAAAAAAFAITGAAQAAPSNAPAAQPASGGVVGVCVRWGDDPHHLAEAIVVEPSGDAALDVLVPQTLRSMTWEKPQGYGGEWMGLSVAVDGAKPAQKVPDCGGVGDASLPMAPLKAARGKRI